jgi:hypothetical protein
MPSPVGADADLDRVSEILDGLKIQREQQADVAREKFKPAIGPP